MDLFEETFQIDKRLPDVSLLLWKFDSGVGLRVIG
jgi:hypothetical protein